MDRGNMYLHLLLHYHHSGCMGHASTLHYIHCVTDQKHASTMQFPNNRRHTWCRMSPDVGNFAHLSFSHFTLLTHTKRCCKQVPNPVYSLSFTTLHNTATLMWSHSSSLTVAPTPSPSVDPLRRELLSSKPTAVLLLKKVVPAIAQEWLQIGVHLGMEVAILKTFKATESLDLKLCCLEMFECWLQESRGTGASSRTWSTVLSAVGDCLGHDVADGIERGLLEERCQRK